MAWADVRPFFRSHLEAQGFTEWTDGFYDIQNIPETIIDKAYHISMGTINGDRQNQTDQESTLNIEVRTIHKGFRYPAEAIDAAVEYANEIMCAVVSPQSRTTATGILNVIFNAVDIAPIDNSNDNTVVVTHAYSVRVITAL